MEKIIIRLFDSETGKLTTIKKDLQVITLQEAMDNRDQYMRENNFVFRQSKADFYSYLFYNADGLYMGVYTIAPENEVYSC